LARHKVNPLLISNPMKKLILLFLVALPLWGQSFSGRSSGDVFIPAPFRLCFGTDDKNTVCMTLGANNQVTLTGGTLATASAPATIVVAPTSINFGTQQVGSASPVQNITISNTSTSPAVIFPPTLTGSTDFISSNFNICNGPLPGLAACVLPVQLQPTANGAEAATTLTINTTAQVVSPPTNVVALSGSGTATATFPLSVNCGGGLGSGTIVSGETPPLINAFCNPPNAPSGTTSSNYASGSVVVLTATPGNNGSTFSAFSGGGCSTSPCSVTVSAATNVSATFNPPTPTYVLNIAGTNQGTGTVTSDSGGINCTSTAGLLTGTCSATFPQGKGVILTEVPSASCTGGACTFTSWGGVNLCTNATTCTVTMNSANTVSVNFAAPASGTALALIQTIPGGTPGTNNITGNWAQAQTAGDTLIVYALIPDATTTVSSVSDTKGNTYSQSSCSPKVGASWTIALYYAANIAASAAGANTTTVALSASPGGRQLFGLHYAGLTTTPVDVCAAGSGLSTTPSSGNFTTNFANDLLTSATLVSGSINAVSSGWTSQIASTGNDAEDRQGVAIGTYANAPTQTNNGAWTDLAAAWKTTGTSSNSSTLNVRGSGNGSGTVVASGINCTLTAGVATGTCSVIVPANGTLSLTATPTSNSAFTSYSGAGCGTNPSCKTSAITTNTDVTVTFNLLATGAQFYISPSGSDSNSGTSSGAPWKTFAHAIPLLMPGSTLNLANGTYSISNGNGLPYINCATTAHNGTASQPIAIQALNERQAFISGDGSAESFLISNCSYWNVIGLHVESADLNVGNTFTGDVFRFSHDNHLIVRRNIGARPNRYGNVHVFNLENTGGASTNNLIEENEAYYCHRACFVSYGSSNNEFRRNYANNRNYGDINGGYPAGDPFGFHDYTSTGDLFENNIAEGATPNDGHLLNLENNDSNSTWLGNVAYGAANGVRIGPHDTGSGQPVGNSFSNTVSVHPSNICFWNRGGKATWDHNSCFGNSSTVYGAEFDPSVIFGAYTQTVTNSTVQGVSTGTGYLISNTSGVTFSYDHDNNSGNATSYNPNTNVTSPNSANPTFGACYLWAPDGTPLVGAGVGGTNIGATIEYEYINGALTTIPLWSAASGSFRQGATVSGLNDQAGTSLYDVQSRINAKQNGCAFRASYTGW
jgi:hypothetical protein